MKNTNKGVASKGTGRAGSDTDATKGGVMDPVVRQHISRAINDKIIEKCNGAIKEGKEAIIFHAEKGAESGGFDVAIKVFKKITEFRNRGYYVDGDPRFAKTNFSNRSKKDQLELWTEKEYRNLIRASRAGVPVPIPLFHKDNILFMRFLGDNGWPSPQLRELELNHGSRRWNTLFSQIMEAVTMLVFCFLFDILVLSDYFTHTIPICFVCFFILSGCISRDIWSMAICRSTIFWSHQVTLLWARQVPL
jgi:serine/threonine-protein kinase RIO1